LQSGIPSLNGNAEMAALVYYHLIGNQESDMKQSACDKIVNIRSDGTTLQGRLVLPAKAIGVVVFAQGSGSLRFSPRNNPAVGVLQQVRIGTLLMDLLTPQEDVEYENRFDIELLTSRLLAAMSWLQTAPLTNNLMPGLFGTSTGAAAALRVAATLGSNVAAVVLRGGRPDLAGDDSLRAITAPTLMIVGELDDIVLRLNEKAYALMACEKSLEIIPRASHLFEEPGTLEQMAHNASAWFEEKFLYSHGC
jgi:putative phosphoribosyl transferase